MKVATKFRSLGETFSRLLLDTLFRLPDVVEAGHRAVYIRVDLFPRLDMEAGVTLGDLADDDPVFELTDVLLRFVTIVWEGRSHLVANWTHIMIIAVVDICFIVGS